MLVLVVVALAPFLGVAIGVMIRRFWVGRGRLVASCQPLDVDAPIDAILLRSRNALIYERAMIVSWPIIAGILVCAPVYVLLGWFYYAHGWRDPLLVAVILGVAALFLFEMPLVILDILVGSLPQYYSTPPWLREQRLNERRIIVRRLNDDAQKRGSRRRINEEWWIPWWARERDS